MIHAFHIPKDLLNSLIPVEAGIEVSLDTEQEEITTQALQQLQLQEERLANEQQQELEGTNEFTCHTCEQVFTERNEQRLHFNSDWHRYNIKRKLVMDVPPVSYSTFESLLEDLTESLSGSEEEEEDEDEELSTGDKVDNISALVNKQQQQDETRVEHTPYVLPIVKKYSALTWYKTDNQPDIHYGIYRHLLNQHSLSELQQSEWKGKKRTWTVIMLGGGHFAGAVFDISSSQNIDQVSLITHKTFHRYTTRRKQGGAQSSNDNAKGKAKSAGAQIRRYNEQLLQQEVRDVLAQWRQHITTSEHIFIHAPSSNKKIIFNYEGAVLSSDKVNSIPFATRRPTLNELKRVYKELITVKIVEMNEELVAEHKQKWIMKEEKNQKILQNSVVIKKKEAVAKKVDNPALDKLIKLIKQNKTSVTLSFMEKHMNLPYSDKLPNDISEDTRQYPTLLHIAAHEGGNAVLVSELLRNYDANPTIISEAGKTAYEVSKDKDTRNAFRRCMHDMPHKWRWLEEGRVPSPLSKAQEEELLKKEKKKMEKEAAMKRSLEMERLKMEREMEKQEEEERRKEEEAKLAKLNAERMRRHQLPIAQALGGRTSNTNMANMTPEARIRLEREKRARAAEERLKKKS
ncbi:hypothetical protein BDB01DRAFT_717360 [Pilobolus umbonatus]|nr:hypothetical protein BDB01DRAFT_717360 [Pilobolus umbonatus]